MRLSSSPTFNKAEAEISIRYLECDGISAPVGPRLSPIGLAVGYRRPQSANITGAKKPPEGG